MTRKKPPVIPQIPHAEFLPILLKSIDPFSFLPEEEIDKLSNELFLVKYPKGTLLFVQGRSPVAHLHILQKGAAQRYYERNNQKTMIGVLGQGDSFGGISMLLNDSIAIRSLDITEESYFYLLKRERFLELCLNYPAFSEYFTDIFGKRMLNRSYAAIIAKTVPHDAEALQFFNQSIETICNRNVIFGADHMSIQAAAQAMRAADSSFIFIQNDDGATIGILTEQDLTRKVIAGGIDIKRAVADIISTPLLVISEQALVFEALMAMLQNDVRHLAVENNRKDVTAVVRQREFLVAQGHSHLFLIGEIANAKQIEEIERCRNQIPLLVRDLIANGANAKNVNRFITAVSDVITNRVMQMVLEQSDAPPVPFAFMVMGSEGRGEQTLKTDQDNAIVYADCDADTAEKVNAYFLTVGQKVTAMLDQVGYAYCIGNVMARNPKWCQPLSVWKGYFSNWIHTAEPEDLLQASIFFDFRFAYGDAVLVDQLRAHLFNALEGWSGFFRHLTENGLYFKPPLGFFRNFVVESKGKHRHRLDIKSAMTPIVDFARIYALKHKIAETNTLERLRVLRRRKVLSSAEYEELEKGYGFLMQMRFVRQVTAALDEKMPPDNFINPKKLTRIEQTMLKEIFRRIEKFQAKMNFEFIGIA